MFKRSSDKLQAALRLLRADIIFNINPEKAPKGSFVVKVSYQSRGHAEFKIKKKWSRWMDVGGHQRSRQDEKQSTSEVNRKAKEGKLVL